MTRSCFGIAPGIWVAPATAPITVRGHTKWTSLNMNSAGEVLECRLKGISFTGAITNGINWSCVLAASQLHAGANDFQACFRDPNFSLALASPTGRPTPGSG